MYEIKINSERFKLLKSEVLYNILCWRKNSYLLDGDIVYCSNRIDKEIRKLMEDNGFECHEFPDTKKTPKDVSIS